MPDEAVKGREPIIHSGGSGGQQSLVQQVGASMGLSGGKSKTPKSRYNNNRNRPVNLHKKKGKVSFVDRITRKIFGDRKKKRKNKTRERKNKRKVIKNNL